MAKGYPKITISVDKELYKKINEFRDQIKISDICRSALRDRVETLYRLKYEIVANKEEIITRLKKEKEEIDKTDYDLGFMDGFKFASQTSYKVLVTAVQYFYDEVQVHLMMNEGNLLEDLSHSPFNEEGQDFYLSWIEEGTKIKGYCSTITQPPFNWFKYSWGWYDGLMQFWIQVQEALY